MESQGTGGSAHATHGTPIIVVDRLTKKYPTKLALSECSLQIESGEIFGVLGPNGAGKSTLLRLLLGYLRPTSGSAKAHGLDCYGDRVRVHRLTSYLPGDARLFPKMKGRDVLKFFASIRPQVNLTRCHQLAERLELDLTIRVAYMSTGMRQKLALAAVLAVDTPLLVLDEPTANLDPTVRSEINRLVIEARDAGRTVVFSSHVLSEVEDACDRVVILRQGQVVHTQVMRELRQQHRIRATLTAELPPTPGEFDGEVTVRRLDSQKVVIETSRELAPLLGWLATCPLAEIHIEPVGLRAVYDRFQHETVGP